MALEAGTRLGSYRVVAPLGAGAMGEVYRASDATLGREVAIKVLPADVALEPERYARFEREARALAALNHPNVATVHGFEVAVPKATRETAPSTAGRGDAGPPPGIPFLVMELVDGETLADRIQRGPVPLAEALALLRQIAEGLEAAHDRGIVHRDLKPANVKVTPGGRVKILDFGLAKRSPGSAAGVGADDETRTYEQTVAGVLLGTPAYMSPEQARGGEVEQGLRRRDRHRRAGRGHRRRPRLELAAAGDAAAAASLAAAVSDEESKRPAARHRRRQARAHRGRHWRCRFVAGA
jgi:serine/threonine-protein kinase